MDLKDYINKNLPNLNWNILPQIFEENNVELTEEIVEYLKTTPWNTNWSILDQISESGELVLFEGEIDLQLGANYVLGYTINNLFIEPNLNLTIILDGTKAENITWNEKQNAYIDEELVLITITPNSNNNSCEITSGGGPGAIGVHNLTIIKN